jgi:hypothetical protein
VPVLVAVAVLVVVLVFPEQTMPVGTTTVIGGVSAMQSLPDGEQM